MCGEGEARPESYTARHVRTVEEDAVRQALRVLDPAPWDYTLDAVGRLRRLALVITERLAYLEDDHGTLRPD